MSTIEEIREVMREFCLFAICDKQERKKSLEKTDVGCDLETHSYVFSIWLACFTYN